ncbi:MAG TPA: diacylglycerol kinase family lipid kinase [Nitrospirae bacterium]|nr:diacylglycerol kinase family lipid kinase [Nitrospirota bacterium]
MSTYKKIFLIVNPAAGGSENRSLSCFNTILKKRGYEVIIKETNYKGHCEEICKEISKDKSFQNNTLIIACGGDGTYNEVANGLVYSNIPMAVLPLGTTSVLARELFIPLKIDDAIETILNGRVIFANLGLIKFLKQTNLKSRYFILMAGIGYDAETVKNVDLRKKRIFGKFAYISSGMKTFFTYKTSHIDVRVDENYDIDCSNIIICKSSRYGGSFIISPEATLLSPYFYCFTTVSSDKKSLLKYILAILSGQHLRLKDIRYFKAHNLIIEGNGSIQIDGDYLGSLPISVSIAEKAIRLVVSQKFLDNKAQ